jgi:hypothetical protein
MSIEDSIITIQSDIQHVRKELSDLRQDFIRTKEYYRSVIGTIGSITVATAPINFPGNALSDGEQETMRSFIKQNKVTRVRITNLGNDAVCMAFNRCANNQEPLVIYGMTFQEFDFLVSDYISLIALETDGTTTVRVTFWGE